MTTESAFDNANKNAHPIPPLGAIPQPIRAERSDPTPIPWETVKRRASIAFPVVMIVILALAAVAYAFSR